MKLQAAGIPKMNSRGDNVEQVTQQLQQMDNAAHNLTREILAAGPKLVSVTDEEKQAILARLYADRETVKGIITEATTALNKYALGLLESVDKGLSNCERMVTQ